MSNFFILTLSPFTYIPGEWKDTRPFGRGNLRTPEGDLYEGYWMIEEDMNGDTTGNQNARPGTFDAFCLFAFASTAVEYGPLFVLCLW